MQVTPRKKTKKKIEIDVNTLLVHGDDGIEELGGTRVEDLMGKLEGGRAVVYPSGTAATMAVLVHYNPNNVWIRDGYKGTAHTLEQFMRIKFPGAGHEHIRRFKEDVQLNKGDIVWIETPKNPMCDIEDIAAISQIVRKAEAYCVVDSTFATPILQKPLELGAHVVVHSATKFLAGHSDVLSGIVVCAESRDAFGLASERTNSGAIMGNLENFLLLRSLRTLELRVSRQSESASKIAKFLSRHSLVLAAYHPSLSSHPGHKLCKEQMRGPPPVLSFLVPPKLVEEILKNFKIIKSATSLGGIHTTIDWRYPYDSSLDPGLLRLSVGIEGVKDLKGDLKQAFEAASHVGKEK